MAAQHDDDASARASRVSETSSASTPTRSSRVQPRAAQTAIREAIQAGLRRGADLRPRDRPGAADGGRSLGRRSHLGRTGAPRDLDHDARARAAARGLPSRTRAVVAPRAARRGARGAPRRRPGDGRAACSRNAGYQVRLFGADLPVAEIAAAVDMHKPVAIGFTTATPESAMNLPAAFEAARDRRPRHRHRRGRARRRRQLADVGRRRVHPRRRCDRARRRARQTGGPQLSRSRPPEWGPGGLVHPATNRSDQHLSAKETRGRSDSGRSESDHSSFRSGISNRVQETSTPARLDRGLAVPAQYGLGLRLLDDHRLRQRHRHDRDELHRHHRADQHRVGHVPRQRQPGHRVQDHERVLRQPVRLDRDGAISSITKAGSPAAGCTAADFTLTQAPTPITRTWRPATPRSPGRRRPRSRW